MKRVTTMLFAVTALGVANMATAGNVDFSEKGFYAGGSLGRADIDFSETSSYFNAVHLGGNGDDITFKIFGGYKILRYEMIDIAAEITYTDFGSSEGNATINSPGNYYNGQKVGSVSVDASAISFSGLVSATVGVVDIFGKLGLAKGNVDVTATYNNVGIETLDSSKWKIFYGVGAKKQFGPIEVRGEYEIFDLDGAEVNYLSVGGSYKFM